jgi:hypothetical protein
VPEDIDFAHLPSGQLAWRALVEQISKIGPRSERHFCEIKSEIDLGTNEGRAKVTKFILGAANRDPEKAAARFDGRALMFLGIGEGTTPGIPSFEALELQRYVHKFTGNPGPEWDFERIEVGDNKAIIVIIVGPPDPARQPWVCESQGLEKLDNGRVYIRGDGDTRGATADELNAMLARRAAAAAPQVDLSLEVVGTVRSYVWDEAVLDEWLRRKRQWLLDALPKPKTSMSSGPLANVAAAYLAASAASSFLGGAMSDKRSKDDYVAEIDAWEAAVRQELPTLLDEVAGFGWDGVVIRVRNNTDTYLDGPEFRVHIEGPVEALPKRDKLVDLLDQLPNPPRRWGPVPYVSSLMAQQNSLVRLANYASYVPPTSFHPRHGVVRFENGGSVDLRFSLEELRPRAIDTSDDDDFVLILRAESADVLRGTWEATVRGHHAVYQGDLQVTVSSKVDDVSGWLTRCFEEDEDLKPEKEEGSNKST